MDHLPAINNTIAPRVMLYYGGRYESAKMKILYFQDGYKNRFGKEFSGILGDPVSLAWLQVLFYFGPIMEVLEVKDPAKNLREKIKAVVSGFLVRAYQRSASVI